MIVRLTERAEADIASAFDWYERQKPDLGYRFMARVDEAMEKIAENATLYAPLVGEVRHVIVEQFPYAVWFTVEEDAIVIACLHAKRNPRLIHARASLKPEP